MRDEFAETLARTIENGVNAKQLRSIIQWVYNLGYTTAGYAYDVDAWAEDSEPCCEDHANDEDDRAPGEADDYDGIDMTGHEGAVEQNDNMMRGNAAWRGEK